MNIAVDSKSKEAVARIPSLHDARSFLPGVSKDDGGKNSTPPPHSTQPAGHELQVTRNGDGAVAAGIAGRGSVSPVMPVTEDSQPVSPSSTQKHMDLVWDPRTKQWLSHEQIASTMSGLDAIALVYASESDGE